VLKVEAKEAVLAQVESVATIVRAA